MNQTIFITGASSGIGKAAAKLFASKGWNVIATMRTPEKETELNTIRNISLLKLDVTVPQEIYDTVQDLLQKHEVDVVFNNAGYALMGALEAVSDEEIRAQMETNFFGVVRVTKAFIPYFRERGRGLFITTGSSAGLAGFPMGCMYDASKWAIEGWSESLSYELSEFNIGIKTIEPGMVSTEIMNKSPMVPHPAYDSLLNKFVAAVMQQENMTTPEQIAEVVYGAATDGSKKLRYVCGEDAIAMYTHRLEVGDEAFREGISEMMNGGRSLI